MPWRAGYLVLPTACVQAVTCSSGAQQALQRLARSCLHWSCSLAGHREQSAAISLDQLGRLRPL